jgi:hypothetical protein
MTERTGVPRVRERNPTSAITRTNRMSEPSPTRLRTVMMGKLGLHGAFQQPRQFAFASEKVPVRGLAPGWRPP